MVTSQKFEIRKWRVGASEFSANVEAGARLVGWKLNLAGCSREVLYWDKSVPQDGFGESYSSARGGNPILFPFCGRSFADGREGHWRTPEGEIKPMYMHGFAAFGKFELETMSECGFVARYVPDAAAKASFAYDYNFRVEYEFAELSLICRMTLENLGDVRIPWGAGCHFYFTLPWHAGLTRENYRIVHDAKSATLTTKEGVSFPSRLDANCFADPDIKNRVLTKLKTGKVKFGLKNGEEDISLTIDGGGKPAVGTSIVTWAEFDDSPYYCVEPWMAPPNTQSKPLHFVEPKGVGRFEVKVALD